MTWDEMTAMAAQTEEGTAALDEMGSDSESSNNDSGDDDNSNSDSDSNGSDSSDAEEENSDEEEDNSDDGDDDDDDDGDDDGEEEKEESSGVVAKLKEAEEDFEISDSFKLKKVVKKIALRLYPKQLEDLKKGINETLRSRLMHYNTEFEGVPVSYTKVKLSKARAVVHEDSPVIHAYAKVHFQVFCPRAGDVYNGVVTKVTVDNLGVLVRNTFNASIARSALPDGYEYREDLGAYVLNDMDNVSIAVGTKVRLRITVIEESHGILVLTGAIEDRVQ